MSGGAQKIPWMIFGLMLMLVTFFLLRTASQLPPMVASHFDVAGYPNAFVTRGHYTRFMLALGVVLPIAIVALMTWVYLRADDMKLPNRAYWLAPERIDRTRHRLVAHSVWIGSLLIAMVCFVHWLEIAAHRRVPAQLSNAAAMAGMLVFFLIASGWIIALVLAFRRPRGA
jgi:uncharacterized membrane protein